MLKHLGGLQYFAITNNVAKNNLLHMYFHILGGAPLGSIPRSEITESKNKSICIGVLLDIMISSLGCFLAPTTNFLILQTPTECLHLV